MMTERLRAAVDRAAQLPVEAQEELAAALEAALNRTATDQVDHVPPMRPEVRAAFERALAENAATLEYLKDR